MNTHRFKRNIFAFQAIFFVFFGSVLTLMGIFVNPIMILFSLFFFFAGASIWKGVSMSGMSEEEWEEYRKKRKRRKRRRKSSRGFVGQGMSRTKNLETSYDVLDVDSGASMEEIHSAYRERVKDVHPDQNASSNAKEEFREVQDAYENIKRARK